MKPLRPLFPGLLFWVCYLPLHGQIVLHQSDMPAAGDTIRVSVTNIVPPDFSKTGRDTTWDFSMLQPMNQRVDTFVPVTATPPEYWLFFIPGVVANLASPKGAGDFFPGFPVQQYYTFYKKSSDAFVDAGFAFKMQGVTMPAKYNNPDKYYTFPLDTNSIWGSVSTVGFSFPGMFYFSTSRNRSSFVDGWGTVITPFGSFETIRVRSDLNQHDSIFIDSLGFGYGLNRNITEYKWMAKNMGIPVLQINSEGLLASATYRDSTRLPVQSLSVTLGPDTTVNKGATITLYAQVSGGTPPYRYFWNTLDTSSTLTVTMDTTRIFVVVAVDGMNTFASDQKLVTVVSPGIDEPAAGKLELFPNPSPGAFHIRIPQGSPDAVIIVTDNLGRQIFSERTVTGRQWMTLDLSDFPDGLYHLRIITPDRIYAGQVLLMKFVIRN